MPTTDESKAPNVQGPMVGPSTLKRKRSKEPADQNTEENPQKRKEVVANHSRIWLSTSLMTHTIPPMEKIASRRTNAINGFDATGSPNGSTTSLFILGLQRTTHSILLGVIVVLFHY